MTVFFINKSDFLHTVFYHLNSTKFVVIIATFTSYRSAIYVADFVCWNVFVDPEFLNLLSTFLYQLPQLTFRRFPAM